MRLSRFFIDDKLTLHRTIAPPDSVAHYMRNVLRLKDTDQALLFDGREPIDYRATIRSEGKKLLLTPIEAIAKHSDSTLDIHLLLAVGKPEHIDLALQKTTELGIHHVSLFNSERTQIPIKGKRLEKKLAHWRGVMVSACEQCGRNRLPLLEFFPSLHKLLQQPLAGHCLILDFAGEALKQRLAQLDSKQAFHLLIGAEGGLSEQEIGQAKSVGFDAIYLGPRVLRMETAATSITSLIQHHFGDLG